MKPVAAALGLFAVTAAAEIVGCYLVYLWPSAWDLAGAGIALAGMALIALQPAR